MFRADSFYMSQALIIAKRGRLSVSPNPVVGCIIVKNSEIIGEGWHRFLGDKHAEIHALDQAGNKAENSTVYVTLEPCCHIGRTGACTEKLIKAKVCKVVIASVDPSTKVSGKGIKRLQQAGIIVSVGLMQEESREMNPIFFHYHNHHLPYVIAKWGMSLDGEMTTNVNDVKQITGKESQIQVHNLRNQVDAIIVGKNTVIEDNPKLTVRVTDAKFIKHPVRVVLSKTAKLPLDAAIFNDKVVETIVFTSYLSDRKITDALRYKGIECIVVALNRDQELNLVEVLKILATRGISSVLVEGGKTILDSFFSTNLVNEVQSYISPVIISNLEKKLSLDPKNRGFFQSDYNYVGLLR